MRHREVPILLSLALLGGCSGGADPSTDTPARDPEPSEVVLQAVDAGTGAALTDGQLTVRYLVRSPITLDASAVDQVSSSEPYRIAHAVAEDSLVVELRLEARSYHRLDTVSPWRAEPRPGPSPCGWHGGWIAWPQPVGPGPQLAGAGPTRLPPRPVNRRSPPTPTQGSTERCCGPGTRRSRLDSGWRPRGPT